MLGKKSHLVIYSSWSHVPWNGTVSHEELVTNPGSISTAGEPRAEVITKHPALGVTCSLLAGSTNSSKRMLTPSYYNLKYPDKQ